jgi:hypothetical protein
MVAQACSRPWSLSMREECLHRVPQPLLLTCPRRFSRYASSRRRKITCGSAGPLVNMRTTEGRSNLFRVLVLDLLQPSVRGLLYASHFEWQQTFIKMSSFPHGLKSECSLLFEPMVFMFWVYYVFAVTPGKSDPVIATSI